MAKYLLKNIINPILYKSVDLLRTFLQKIQSLTIPPQSPDEEWMVLSSNDNIQENTQWLTADLLEDILAEVLETERTKSENIALTNDKHIKDC